MVQCPRCGAISPNGLPQCPHCGVPFVARSPLDQPRGVAPMVGQSAGGQLVPKAWIFGTVGVLALVCLLWLGVRISGSANAKTRSTASDFNRGGMMQVIEPTAPPPVLNGTDEGEASKNGMFRVESQQSQPPVISIGNGTSTDLRFQIEDSSGTVQTEWIRSGETRDITVRSGDYRATIDSPGDPYDQPTNGEVDVKDFHRYSAFFVLVPPGEASDFYIGD